VRLAVCAYLHGLASEQRICTEAEQDRHYSLLVDRVCFRRRAADAFHPGAALELRVVAHRVQHVHGPAVVCEAEGAHARKEYRLLCGVSGQFALHPVQIGVDFPGA
jgi:hypothetical protein